MSSRSRPRTAPRTLCRSIRRFLGPGALLLASDTAHAQDYWREQGADRPAARVDVPLVDAPYNWYERRKAYSVFNSPSMQQSLGVSSSLYNVSHAALARLIDPNHASFWPRFFIRFGFLTFDYVTFDVPGYAGWLHEEWHRATMTRRGVRSYNEVNDYFKGRPSDAAIAVSGESDADLSRMKREHPEDFVRLQAAGWEAQWEQNRLFADEAFFFGTRAWNVGTTWLNLVNNYSYLSSCTTGQSDEIVDEFNENDEPENKRDFTGPDCTGWVYDLYKPDEPWEKRGRHPTGQGVDRYRKLDDLTPSEKRYLARTTRLSLLNFVDPFAYGFEDFWWQSRKGDNAYWNARMFHHLTSFGGDTGAGVYVKRHKTKGYLALHTYHNRTTFFPGIEWKWVDATVHDSLSPLRISPRAMAWMQPRSLRFHDTKFTPGGLVSVRFDYRDPEWLQPWIEFEGKTRGWVAGVVNQDAGVAGRAGVASEF